MLGIGHNSGMTRRTTGGVDTNRIVQVTAYQSPGIVIAQIGLRREGDLTDVLRSVDGIGGNAQLSQVLLVEGGIQTNLDGLLQFLYLELPQLLTWHFLNLRLPALAIGLDGSHDFLVSHILVVFK